MKKLILRSQLPVLLTVLLLFAPPAFNVLKDLCVTHKRGPSLIPTVPTLEMTSVSSAAEPQWRYAAAIAGSSPALWIALRVKRGALKLTPHFSNMNFSFKVFEAFFPI